jgi:RNA polymerase primary sigma factor
VAADRDAVGAWLEAAGRVPLLTAAEELHLGAMVREWQDWPGGADQAPAGVRRRGLRARDRMASANLRLVVAVARKFTPAVQRRGLRLEDGLQEGVIGLMRGVEKFDPAAGYKFSTYGYFWIRQAIGRWLHSSAVIRLPGNVSEELGRLSVAEIEAMAPGKRERMQAALASQQLSRLDAPVKGSDGERTALGDLVAADAPDPLEALHWADEAERLAAADPEAWGVVVGAISSNRGLETRAAQQAVLRLRVV